MDIFISKFISRVYANQLPFIVFLLSIMALILMTTSAHAIINCAGYLPNSYFERIENEDRIFAGKLITLEDNTQQLQDLNGNTLLSGLANAYVLMDKYLLASKETVDGEKYGVVTATGEVIVPFAYDDIQTEPDIYNSFIVSINTENGLSKQGIINRHGDWIYPTVVNSYLNQRRRVDNGYGDYSYSKSYSNQFNVELIKAVDAPLNIVTSSISHAHYDSDNDRDYFLIKSSAEAGILEKVGLLNDKGVWVIPQQYDALQPLNACSGQPLYLQATLTKEQKQQTALLDQHANIIISFAFNQNTELFNSDAPTTLFLRSSLIKGSTATGLTQDIEEDIVSAQIIDANGKVILSSESAIVKLLYHQFYVYKQAGKFGLIDEQANVVLMPQFDSYYDEGDKVWVERNGEMKLIETIIKLD